MVGKRTHLQVIPQQSTQNTANLGSLSPAVTRTLSTSQSFQTFLKHNVGNPDYSALWCLITFLTYYVIWPSYGITIPYFRCRLWENYERDDLSHAMSPDILLHLEKTLGKVSGSLLDKCMRMAFPGNGKCWETCYIYLIINVYSISSELTPLIGVVLSW